MENPSIGALQRRIDVLEAKDAMRATLMRYMDLCDVPGPLRSTDQLAELFTPQAVWEGIGPEYEGKFGRVTGRHQIAEMVAGYLPPAVHFERNAHLVGSEQLEASGVSGRGQWIMQQLSHYDASLGKLPDLLCARLTIDFAITRDAESCTALIRHFRTRRMFAAPLAATPGP